MELQRAYLTPGTSIEERRVASLWAFVVLGLLLRRPPRSADGVETAGCVPLKTVLSNRLKRAEVAENGLLRELLDEYLAERAADRRRAADRDGRVQGDVLEGWQRAVKSVQADCVARARREATGQRWAARDEATRAEMLRLAVADVPDGEREAIEAQVAALAPAIAGAKPPRKASLRRRIFGPSFRRGAAPGPSGIRNAYIAALASLPGGVDALHGFGRLEVAGVWHEDDSLLWHAGILEPADCGERAQTDETRAPDRKLRPLAQTEVLVKMVETALIDEVIEELRATLEPRQLGVVTPDGPVRVVKLLRAWLEDMCEAEEEAAGRFPAESQLVGPDVETIAELDLENAYGRFFRSSALSSAAPRSPRVAALAAVQWKHGRVTIWQRMAGGSWVQDASWRGGFQGSRLAQVMFALDLEGAFSELAPNGLVRVGVADDTYLTGSLRSLIDGWPAMEATLAGHGHRLAAHKSHVLVPALDSAESRGAAQADPEVTAFFDVVPRSCGSLPMLGAAAQGKFDTELGPFAAMAGPAAKRVDAACMHLAALRDMVRARVHEQADQAVWTVLQQSVARALEYDMRLCPWVHLEAHAARLAAACHQTLEELLGCQLDDHARKQATLPGALGGLSLSLPSELRAAAAFHAAEVAHCGPVQRLVVELGRPTRGSTADASAAAGAAETLREEGVEVRQAVPAFTAEARRRYDAGPWAADTPAAAVFAFPHPAAPRAAPDVDGAGGEGGSWGAATTWHTAAGGRSREYGRAMRALDALRATELHAAMPVHRQTCLLSSGGEGTGAFWSTAPSRPPLRAANARWAMATRTRLGLACPPQRGLACSMRGAGDDEPCGLPLDDHLHHPSLCPRGRAGRLRIHNTVAAVLRRHLERTGAFVDTERHIPELYVLHEGEVRERIMDLVAWWPASGRRFLVDVTVRSPFASELQRPHVLPGEAARGGEADKRAHYGEAVVPLSLETFGRFGPQALQLASALHWESCEFGRLRPGCGRAVALPLRALRADLEAAVVLGAAEQSLAALGCTAVQALGWPASRAAKPARPSREGAARRGDRGRGHGSGAGAGGAGVAAAG